MEAEIKEIKKLGRQLQRRMEQFGPEHINTVTVDDVKEEMNQLRDIWEEYDEAIDALLEQYEKDVNKEEYEGLTKTTREIVRKHRVDAFSKAEEVKKSMDDHMSAYERETLELNKKQLALAEEKKIEEKTRQDKEELIHKSEILGKANKKYDAIINDAKELSDEVKSSTTAEGKDLSDADVGKLVRKIGKWKESRNKLVELGRGLDELTTYYRLVDEKMKKYKTVIEETCVEVKGAIDKIEAEETSRKLYTLDPGKTEMCKLPSFAGNPTEDFVKFQKKVEDCFQKNRTSKTDQLDKLREVLKGQAKLLVPESTEDIDKAWEILVKHYADPSNTMKARKDSLLSIGKLPSDTSKTNSHMKQVEWYIKLDHIIGEIIELGGRNTEMEREAFCQSTITTILNLFPSIMLSNFL